MRNRYLLTILACAAVLLAGATLRSTNAYATPTACVAVGGADGCYPTFAAAAAAVASGSTIDVHPGSYGSDSISAPDKILTFTGADAGIDPTNPLSTRPDPSESFVKLEVTAGDITLDGFVFDAAGSGTALRGLYTAVTTKNALTVKNSVIENGFFGIELPSNTLLPYLSADHNYFHDNGTSASANQLWAISPDTTTKIVTNNLFDGNDNADININYGTTVTVTGNDSNNDATLLVATQTDNLTVSSNVGGFNGDGTAIFIGKGNRNVTISDNNLAGAIRGVKIASDFGGENGRGATVGTVQITRNTITNSSSSGIFMQNGSFSGPILIDHNIIQGTSVPAINFEAGSGVTAAGSHVTNNDVAAATVGITWPDSGTLDGTCNWWGASSGPTGGQTSGSVDAAPWLTSTDLNGACPAGFSASQSVVTVASPTDASGTADQITLTAKDGGGNQLDTGGASVIFTVVGGTSTGVLSPVTDHGDGTYTATFTGVVAGTPTAIHATYKGTSITSPAPTITVTAGPFSLVASRVTLASPTVVSGNTDLFTLTAKDSAGNVLGTGGAVVNFFVDGGGSTGTLGPVVDHLDGTYTTLFTGALAGTPSQVNATYGGSFLYAVIPMVTVTGGPFSGSRSTIKVASPAVTSGATDLVTLTTRDPAGNLLGVGGGTVTFGTSGGTSTGTFGTVTDHGDGTYTALFTGAGQGTATTVTGTYTGPANDPPTTPISSSLPTIAVQADGGSPSSSTVVASPSSVVSDGVTTSTITVTLLDDALNPLSGRTVFLAQSAGKHSTLVSPSALSNSSGVATFMVRDTTAETVTYTATDSTDHVVVEQTADVTFTPGPVLFSASTVTASPASGVVANGVAASTITVTLKDAHGNGVNGKSVSLAQTAGKHSTIGASSGLSNASGVVTFSVTNQTAETVNYTATDTTDAHALSQSPAVTFVAGPADAGASTVAAAPGSVVANGTTTATVTITIKDANGNGISGKTVTLAQDAGKHSTIAGPSATTNASGVATFTVKNSTAESVTYTATDVTDGFVVAQTTLVTFTAGPVSASASTVTASSAFVIDNGVTTSTITVTLNDSHANPVSGKTVTLSQTAGRHSVISAASGPSDASGVVTFTVADGTAEAVTYTARDATDSLNLTPTASVTFVLGPASAAGSTVTASAASVPANGFTTATITVTLKDAAGNGIPAKTIVLSQPAGKHSTIAGPSAATNASGVATFTVKDATAESVVYTATDTTDGVVILQTPTVLFLGPISASISTAVASLSSVPANGSTTSTITVTLRDSAGNPISGKTVSLTQAAGKHSTISVASGTSDASGVVTFTVRDAVPEQVVYTARDVTDAVNITQTVTVTFS